MGWFSRKKQKPGNDGALTLAETWTRLGKELGLEVEVLRDDAIRASGSVDGRRLDVWIEAGSDGVSGAIRDAARAGAPRTVRGGGPRRTWRTVVSVGCTNPRGPAGSVTSAVDVRDPSWDPRNFDPAHCRVVRAEPAELDRALLVPPVVERLMGAVGDVTITVADQRVTLDVDADVGRESGFIAGSIVHQLPESMPAWPERGLVDPRWWIGTLRTVAEAVDGA